MVFIVVGNANQKYFTLSSPKHLSGNMLLLLYIVLIVSVATCPNLQSLTNGAITYNPNTSLKPRGTIATHGCISGYVLTQSGGTVNPRVCQSDRTWSGGSITCQRELT